MSDSKILLGASFYSFRYQYFLKQKSLEQLIEQTASFGARGVETLAEQMMPAFPYLDDAFYAQWHEWMDKYGTVATAHDAFLDTTKFRGRELTVEECVEQMTWDIEHAGKLGASIVRGSHETPVAAMERVLDLAEKNNVKFTFEVHAPRHWDDPANQKYMELFEKYGNEHLGFTLDLGLFAERPSGVAQQRAIRQGARPEFVDEINAAYAAAVEAAGPDKLAQMSQEQIEELSAKAQSPAERSALQGAARSIRDSITRIEEFAPYIHHVHAKFWEMTPGGVEYSMDYPRILNKLVEVGFSGSLSSEYEGQGATIDLGQPDEAGQVAVQQKFMREILGDAAA